MSIKFKICLFILISSSTAFSMIMEDKQKRSFHLYLNSAHLEEPSTDRVQRYGLELRYLNPTPQAFRMGSFVEKHMRLGLDLNLEHDYSKTSGAVNVLQDFYSLNGLVEANYVYLFRFSAFAGPGILLSVTRLNVLDTKETRSQLSMLMFAGLAIDYAITAEWEVGWQLAWQYRFVDEKWDWRQGIGFSYNF